MAYVAPTWRNGQSPGIDEEALNALCQAVAKLPLENGGTFGDSAAAGLYNLINGAVALASTGLATGDYLGIGDVSAGTGKKVTLSNLATWIGANGSGIGKIEVGRYVGTGTYGADNPNSITFSFAPKVVWIYNINLSEPLHFNPANVGNKTILPMYGLSTSYEAQKGFILPLSGNDVYTGYGKKNPEGTQVTWYNTASAMAQLNQLNNPYDWIAFG